MKNIINVFRFTLLFVVITQILVSCRKDDEINDVCTTIPSGVISLNDSLLYCNANDTLRYELDIDGDNVVDVFINQKTSLNGSSASIYYTSINLGNNYEVLANEYTIPYWVLNINNDPLYGDTIFLNRTKRMPLNVLTGNEVTISDMGFEHDSIDIAYLHTNGTLGTPSSNKVFNQLLLEEDITIVLKKTENGQTYLGWIKIKVLGYANIELKSYKEMKLTNSLLIE